MADPNQHKNAAGAAVADRKPRSGGKNAGGAGVTSNSSAAGSGDRPVAVPRSPRFRLYKWPQGYYTRMGTFVGGGVLVLGAAKFVYDNLAFDQGSAAALWLQVGITVAVLVVLGSLLSWLVFSYRKTCDFMIATDGEMKKVNWSNKKEIITSTKVVIVMTLVTAGLLFMTDLSFMNLFQALGVLRSPEGV